MLQSPEKIEVPVWTSGPGLRVNREYLEPEHPESYYNYIKNKLGLTPEDYGYYLHTLSAEQQDILDSISDEALSTYVRLRERSAISREMYG